jgi:hypothetical protein
LKFGFFAHHIKIDKGEGGQGDLIVVRLAFAKIALLGVTSLKNLGRTVYGGPNLNPPEGTDSVGAEPDIDRGLAAGMHRTHRRANHYGHDSVADRKSWSRAKWCIWRKFCAADE